MQVLFVSEQSAESWAEAWWSFSRFQHWSLCLVNLEQALHWPEKHRVNLLIADLAECEGADALAACYPEVVRVLTVPDCRDELLLARFPHYHLFAVHPLVVNQLPAFLQIAEQIQSLPLTKALKNQMLAQVQIPAFPPVVLQLQQLLQDPDASIAQAQDLLAQDPVLSAHVLRLANSAYIGFNLETASLEQALNRLGLNMLYALLLIEESQQSAFTSTQQQATIHLAHRARQAAQLLQLTEEAVEQAFVLGLLLGLAMALSDDDAVLAAQAREERHALAALLAILWGIGSQLYSLLLTDDATQANNAATALLLAEQADCPTDPTLAALWRQLTPS